MLMTMNTGERTLKEERMVRERIGSSKGRETGRIIEVREGREKKGKEECERKDEKDPEQ